MLYFFTAILTLFICRFVLEMHFEIFFIGRGHIQIYVGEYLLKLQSLSRTNVFQDKSR